MNNDELELLDSLLTKTNDWLKFAEAKNGAFIAVVCTVMFGVYKALSDFQQLPWWLLIYFFEFFVFSFLSLLFSLTSFMPRLKKPFWLKIEEKKPSDNPFFFGDACKYSSYEYMQLIGSSRSSESNLAEKMADQIIINSKIAFIKFGLFSSSAWLFLSALITPVGALGIWLLRE